MFWSWILSAFILFGGSGFQDQPLDFSCATFHPFLSESELVAKYRRENVMSGPVTGWDDGPVAGTILNPNRDDARVEITWRDEEGKQNPLWVRVRADHSRWRTPNGLAIGDDLISIERKNGWPFKLAGFTSERHGGLIDWGIGRLGNTPNCKIEIGFQPEVSADASLLRQVTSRSSVSSAHPAMQRINPRVVELYIRFFPPVRSVNPDDALLDLLVWHANSPIDSSIYPDAIRAEIEQYSRRAAAYTPKRPVPPSRELGMVYSTQVFYETRLVATSADPKVAALAQSYVTALRPCYEWEGSHDCPEQEARFADEYYAANPKSPFHDYLPLLAAHRWLCASEAYDSEMKTEGAQRTRQLYEERLSLARQSPALLIRTAADRLSKRGHCLAK